MAAARRQFSTRRLLRDMKELRLEPVIGVTVIPTESNVFQYTVFLEPQEGPMKGKKYCLQLTFPESYPDEAPTLKMKTAIKHPNVFGEWVCLNMLRPTSLGSYSGWSSAYSLSSIVMQLQTFLFAENVPQDAGHTIKNYSWKQRRKPKNNRFTQIDEARQAKPKPEHEQHRQDKDAQRKDSPKRGLLSSMPVDENSGPAEIFGNSHACLMDLPDEILLKICDNLISASDLAALCRSCVRAYDLALTHSLWLRRGLRCFYNRTLFTEDLLGCGLMVSYDRFDKSLKTVTMDLELISHTAFWVQNVRRGPFTKDAYSDWLPVLLNPAHCEAALPLAKGTLARLATGTRSTTSAEAIEAFKPVHALEVLPKLMNQMVVAFMKDISEEEFQRKTEVSPLRASEKALKAYCTCHHLLLQLAASHPEIVANAEYWLSEFLRHQSRRNKAVIHDLGELLVLLTISTKYTWADIAEPLLEEVMCRNVRWYLLARVSKIYPELAYMEEADSVSTYRMLHTFNATHLSRQLLMFQVTFLQLAGRPNGSFPADILAKYARSFGHPAAGMALTLQKAVKNIAAVASWKQYFHHLGIEYKGDLALSQMLRQSVHQSEQKGYHSRKDLLERYQVTWEMVCKERWEWDPSARPPPLTHPDRSTHQTVSGKKPASCSSGQGTEPEEPCDACSSSEPNGLKGVLAEDASLEPERSAVAAAAAPTTTTTSPIPSATLPKGLPAGAIIPRELSKRSIRQLIDNVRHDAVGQLQLAITQQPRGYRGETRRHKQQVKERREQKPQARDKGLLKDDTKADAHRLFVANLPYRVNDAVLANVYKPFGNVVEAKVMTDASTGHSRGFGFVTFAEVESASAAQEHTNGATLAGRVVKVQLAYAFSNCR